MRRLTSLACLAGCGFQAAATDGVDAVGDGGLTGDAAASACTMVTDLGVMLCPATPPTGDLRVSTNTILDTTTGTSTPSGLSCAAMKPGGSPNVCALTALTITIDVGTTLSVRGAKPLVLMATTSINVEGTIDVASHFAGQQGPGSDLVGCSAGTPPSGAAGGQGGSFAGMGGDGGDDENGGQGTAGATISISALRGGCPGARGAGSNGVAGSGGGAVLLAADTITIGNSGTINASGAGGSGANASTNGGTGAGSGGMIVLKATTITLAASGRVFANGGAGGGGSSAISGTPGTDPSGPASGGVAGMGGAGGAGSGGTGYSATQRDGQTGNNNGNGGGGGGGGAGVIKVYSASSIGGSNMSPPPT